MKTIKIPEQEFMRVKKARELLALNGINKLGNPIKNVIKEEIKDFEKLIDNGEGIYLEDFNNEMVKILLDFIVKTEKVEDAVLGILLMGMTRDLTRAIEAASSIKIRENELAKEARQIVVDAFFAFKNSDLEKGKEINDRYQKLSKKLTELDAKKGSKSQILEIEKMARQGANIARILELTL